MMRGVSAYTVAAPLSALLLIGCGEGDDTNESFGSGLPTSEVGSGDSNLETSGAEDTTTTTSDGSSSTTTTSDGGGSTTTTSGSSTSSSGGSSGPCATGFEFCDGQCVSINADVNNCGSCGNVCPTGQACVAGECQTGCATGEEWCNNSCIDPETDNTHCGGCFFLCDTDEGESCSAGNCVCTAGLDRCATECVDQQTDEDHCGACDNACPGAEVCVTGTCELKCGDSTYEPVWEVCDGTAVNGDPFAGNGVNCDTNCTFDLSALNSIVCAAGCSYGGPLGCDQADADVFCKLKLGDEDAVATAWSPGGGATGWGVGCSAAASSQSKANSFNMMGIPYSGYAGDIWISSDMNADWGTQPNDDSRWMKDIVCEIPGGGGTDTDTN